MTLSNCPIRWCQDSGVSQVDLRDHDGSFLGRYVSLVNTVLRVESFSLALGGLKLTLTGGECPLGAREVRFARIKLAAELPFLSCGRFKLLVRCGFRVEQGLLAAQLSQGSVEFRRNRSNAGLCCIARSVCLNNSGLCGVNLSILYFLGH